MRSNGTGSEKAVNSLKRELNPYRINIRLVKKAIDPASFKKDALQSNKILIERMTLEEWLGAETGKKET